LALSALFYLLLAFGPSFLVLQEELHPTLALFDLPKD